MSEHERTQQATIISSSSNLYCNNNMPETQNTSRFSRALTTVFWTVPAKILSYLTGQGHQGQGHQSQSSEQEPQNLGPCRFRLDTAASSKLTLPDGRDLGYAEYGSPTGKPIFCLHGTPGSRIELSFWHHHAERLGLRLVGLDRPGMGWSSPQPGRKVADHAKDVQFLAEHLGLEEYGVMVRIIFNHLEDGTVIWQKGCDREERQR